MNINDVTQSVTAIQSSGGVRQQKSELNMKQENQSQQQGSFDNVSKEKVKTTVDTLNDFLEPKLHNVQFEFHEDLDKYYVTVVDPITEEVIREIPPKKMLDMYAAMAEYMGFLVDKKV